MSEINWPQAVSMAVELVVLVVLPLIYRAARGWLEARAQAEGAQQERRQLHAFDKAVDLVYWAVANIARRTPGTVDDKVAEALRLLAVEQGRQLTTEERERATLRLQATHERRKGSISLANGRNGRTTYKPD